MQPANEEYPGAIVAPAVISLNETGRYSSLLCNPLKTTPIYNAWTGR